MPTTHVRRPSIMRLNTQTTHTTTTTMLYAAVTRNTHAHSNLATARRLRCSLWLRLGGVFTARLDRPEQRVRRRQGCKIRSGRDRIIRIIAIGIWSNSVRFHENSARILSEFIHSASFRWWKRNMKRGNWKMKKREKMLCRNSPEIQKFE